MYKDPVNSGIIYLLIGYPQFLNQQHLLYLKFEDLEAVSEYRKVVLERVKVLGSSPVMNNHEWYS